MNGNSIYEMFMKCEKDFLVKYLFHLDEMLTKYQNALEKACKELEELERKYYYESVTFKHCRSASEWRKEILG